MTILDMNKQLRKTLIRIAEGRVINDPSHDVNHSLRVLTLSEKIAKKESGDLDIIIPAVVFHDIINYPKNHRKRLYSSDESARQTKRILKQINSYPKHKIDKVCEAIRLCSFTKGLLPNFLDISPVALEYAKHVADKFEVENVNLFQDVGKELERKITYIKTEYFGNPLIMETPMFILKTIGRFFSSLFRKNKFLILIMCTFE